MLDHVGIPVSDFMHSKGFYLKVLATLGYGLVLEVASEETGGNSHAGFGPKGKPAFWIGSGKPIKGQVHFAFVAKNRAAVRAFHKAALAAGGRDNGPPGLRPHDRVKYYAAFVLDPDGNRIEAVTFPQG